MKKIFFLLLASYFSVAQDWNYLGVYSGDGRHHPITFSNDRYGYIIGGQNGEGLYLSDVFRYDSQDNSWNQLSDFPGGPRGYAYGVSDSSYAYIGFGRDNSDFLNDFWRYDMNNDIWEELASFPYLGRNHPAMILADNKIFVGMGSVDGENLSDWWEYDIELNMWSQKTDFLYGDRHHPFYFSINDTPYVGFGHGNYEGDNLVIYNDFYKYEIESEIWIQLNDFPSEARVAGTQFSFNGKGYILSGDGDDHGPLDTGELWEYDPTLDVWTQLTSHPGGARWAPGSFVIGCNVFLNSGFEAESGIYHNDLWSFKINDFCGCNDTDAFNYDMNVEIDDGSCCYLQGCTDPNSINYNDLACFNDDSCVPIILGCDNIYASNYDSLANTNSAFTGPNNTDLGPGGFHYNDMWDMVFNVNQTTTIKSVDLYAESSFSTQLEILDINNDQIFSSTINLDAGWNQVDLNFLIIAGNNYKIGINGENSGLYRNSSLPNDVFPINLLNVIEITANTTDSPLDYYYYFYNWQLEIECDVVVGCMDQLACNYNSFALQDDDSCIYAEEFYDCDENCLNDIDIDGICDELDNCSDEFNPDQEDFDFDNIGDACDGLNLEEKGITGNLIKIIDLLGRDTYTGRSILLYIYDNGNIERKYSFE